MMLNLKEPHPTQWLQSFQKTMKSTMLPRERIRNNLTLLGYCLLGSLLFPAVAQASSGYAGMIQNPNNGYLITLASNSSIATNPIAGSDGKNYYRVGEPIVIRSGNPSVKSSGLVNCMGTTWGIDVNYLPPDNAYHRLFIYSPLANIRLNGQIVYRVNNNLVMTIDSAHINNWGKAGGVRICSNVYPGIQQPYSFTSQFPITITFYINDRIIDGQVVIPQLAFGGYVRAFTNPNVAPEFNSWPIEKTTVPMRLASSTLNLVSSCSTTTTGQAGTVNLRHGQLNTLNYDSLVTETVTYNCKFSIPTKVRLRLDYATDDDSQKRLPMTSSQNSNNKIYSELTMTDETTGQTGKDFKIDIKDLRTIKISSHIQGSNAIAGDYRGSAWLIATFD